MTREQKIAALQAKADELIDWFNGKELPAVPFKLNAWTTVQNIEKYVNTCKEVMAEKRPDPFNRLYVLAYYRLLDLKKYIECTSNKLQPPPNNAAG